MSDEKKLKMGVAEEGMCLNFGKGKSFFPIETGVNIGVIYLMTEKERGRPFGE